MAQYLTINSTFKPYTFDELLKPVQLYGEEYARQEATLGELQTKADMWKNIVNETNDPKAYKMYESYMQGIDDITNSLMEGLSPTTRKGVLDMTKRYASEIVPIEQAYTRRQELIDEQRKALANDDSLLFSTDASLLSLDTLIDNPATSYVSASMNKAHKALADDAKALQDAIRNNPDEWKPILDDQYYERVSTYGFTEQEVYDAIMRNPNANPILTNLLDQHMSKFNAFDNTQKELAYRSVAPALYNAIGKQDIDRVQNQGWEKPAIKPGDITQGDLKMWDYLDTTVDTENSQVFRETKDSYDKTSKLIDKWIKNGIPSSEKTTIRTSPYAPYSSQSQIQAHIDPDYADYERLTKEYGTTDLNRIKTILDTEYKSKLQAATNKYTYLNNVASNRLSRYLSTQILSGQTKDTIINKMWQEDEEGKKINIKDKDKQKNYDDVVAALNNSNISFQINFNDGKIRLQDLEHGKYWYIKPEALYNLTVMYPIEYKGEKVWGSAPANIWIENIKNKINILKARGVDGEVIEDIVRPDIEAFYLSIDNTIRSQTKELSASTTK